MSRWFRRTGRRDGAAVGLPADGPGAPLRAAPVRPGDDDPDRTVVLPRIVDSPITDPRMTERRPAERRPAEPRITDPRLTEWLPDLERWPRLHHRPAVPATPAPIAPPPQHRQVPHPSVPHPPAVPAPGMRTPDTRVPGVQVLPLAGGHFGGLPLGGGLPCDGQLFGQDTAQVAMPWRGAGGEAHPMAAVGRKFPGYGTDLVGAYRHCGPAAGRLPTPDQVPPPPSMIFEPAPRNAAPPAPPARPTPPAPPVRPAPPAPPAPPVQPTPPARSVRPAPPAPPVRPAPPVQSIRPAPPAQSIRPAPPARLAPLELEWVAVVNPPRPAPQPQRRFAAAETVTQADAADRAWRRVPHPARPDWGSAPTRELPVVPSLIRRPESRFDRSPASGPGGSGAGEGLGRG